MTTLCDIPIMTPSAVIKRVHLLTGMVASQKGPRFPKTQTLTRIELHNFNPTPDSRADEYGYATNTLRFFAYFTDAKRSVVYRSVEYWPSQRIRQPCQIEGSNLLLMTPL